MKVCRFCGISEDKSLLSEGISKEGVIYVCRKCSFKSDMPLIEKKNISEINLNNPDKVRDRLLAMSKIKKEEYNPELKHQVRVQNFSDSELRKIVETNFEKNLPKEKINYDNLINNFHWVIMRTRRIKKITKEQFAEDIREPIIAIESLERGVLPKDYSSLIRKVESYLNIPIFKDSLNKFEKSNILQESQIPSGMTVADLKKLTDKEKFENEMNSKSINPEEISLDKIEEIIGKPVEDSNAPKKKGFFSRLFSSGE